MTSETPHPTSLPSVLVVDDDAGIREAVHLALADEGYDVHEAANGLEALQHLARAPQAMVALLDLVMPSLDGAEVLHTVEQDHHQLQRHAYILMSAGSRTVPRSLGPLLDGMEVPYLAKPFDVERLMEVVTQAAARLADDQ